MSSTVFAHLTEGEPKLHRAAVALDSWREKQKGRQRSHLSTVRLSRELSGEVSAVEVARIMSMVEHSPDFTIEYRVIDPEGNRVGDIYSDWLEIPEQLTDRSGNEFDVTIDNIEQVIVVKLND